MYHSPNGGMGLREREERIIIRKKKAAYRAERGGDHVAGGTLERVS